MCVIVVFFFQAEDGIRDVERSRGLGDVYKRQVHGDALGIIFFIAPKRLEALWRLAGRTFENLSVGVAKFNGDIPNLLVLKAHRVDPRNCSYYSRFPVSHMANSTNIDCGLPTDNFWRKGSQFCGIQILQTLHGQIAVSYTHLTLPTILLVQISVVAVSLKKKNIKSK
eukprot:TRINITY_DN21880_c0_g1_i3.p2 TRINITY_DN21880_c0_g1~~TRINITY_DN21880_c0_g1_i3.p2  ORF type:complete len:168 (-),score=29.60 TRINITY_DN21880_c0_g1_i3:23-526(-)